MPQLRFTTAGESHGQALVAVLEGIPAGLPLLAADVDAELARRQQGYGRGRRMQIERDHVEFLAGVRAGETTGAPIAMLVRNADWRNWVEIMDPAPRPEDQAGPRARAVTRVRPGHADLVGLLKYDRTDARDILERASARETTVRVAVGAVCKRLLAQFGVLVGSHLVHLGGIDATPPAEWPADVNAAADGSPLRTLDPIAEQAMITRVDEAKRAGDTLGGICEVVCQGLPVGLGSHVAWDRKLDGRLAAALMSIPAVKGVEIGLGFDAARRPGSAVHDHIIGHEATGTANGVVNGTAHGTPRRASNRAGGLEGGITTGEPLVLRVAMKPISTLMRPLGTVDVRTGEPAAASVERSDVTAAPAMGVIAEAMTAFVLAQALLEKCGGDSLGELRRNLDGYLAHAATRVPAGPPSSIAPRPATPHVALVGLPGAGKTTVGQLAATLLDVPFVDFDAELVARTGRSVAEQFARDGEAAFRAAEVALSRELATAAPSLLAPGGGWMTNAEARAALSPTTRTVHLRVSPAVAAERLARDPVVRPLVGNDDPEAALAALLERRRAAYTDADAVVDTDDRSPAQVAAALVALVRTWSTAAPSPAAPSDTVPPGVAA